MFNSKLFTAIAVVAVLMAGCSKNDSKNNDKIILTHQINDRTITSTYAFKNNMELTTVVIKDNKNKNFDKDYAFQYNSEGKIDYYYFYNLNHKFDKTITYKDGSFYVSSMGEAKWNQQKTVMTNLWGNVEEIVSFDTKGNVAKVARKVYESTDRPNSFVIYEYIETNEYDDKVNPFSQIKGKELLFFDWALMHEKHKIFPTANNIIKQTIQYIVHRSNLTSVTSGTTVTDYTYKYDASNKLTERNGKDNNGNTDLLKYTY